MCYIRCMDEIREVQASKLDGSVVAAVIRDGEPRIITYHGRPEVILVKLPNGSLEAAKRLITKLLQET